jgi:hypothetical protein
MKRVYIGLAVFAVLCGLSWTFFNKKAPKETVSPTTLDKSGSKRAKTNPKKMVRVRHAPVNLRSRSGSETDAGSISKSDVSSPPTIAGEVSTHPKKRTTHSWLNKMRRREQSKARRNALIASLARQSVKTIAETQHKLNKAKARGDHVEAVGLKKELVRLRAEQKQFQDHLKMVKFLTKKKKSPPKKTRR